MIESPAFWSRPRSSPGLLPRLLSPLSMIWKLETDRRLRTGAWEKMPIPVICIGNLSVGGTGKTPTTCALAMRLAEQGHRPHIVSRGHGGSIDGPALVDPGRHNSAETGDEPLLLAAFAPTWVARDRASGVRAAAQAGATIALLDDGFQNPSLAKDLSLVVIDAATGFGNGRILPAGPLREPLSSGLARADLLVTIGEPRHQQRLTETWPEIAGLPRLTAHLVPLRTGMDWLNLPVLAFAGIGRPQKFFDSLAAAGAILTATRSFPDHAAYPPALLQRLEAEARAKGAQLVTTEKDAVRLPESFRPRVLAFPVRLETDDWSPLDARLSEVAHGAAVSSG